MTQMTQMTQMRRMSYDAVASVDTAAGTRLGPYDVIGLLGVGGWANCRRARFAA